jgi:hypothetical protein
MASLLFVSIYLSLENSGAIVGSFIVTNEGIITFSDKISSYQLLPNSRLSFVGCWLVFQPSGLSTTSIKLNGNRALTKLFIYRDSLSRQDFSRLAKIIKKLH